MKRKKLYKKLKFYLQNRMRNIGDDIGKSIIAAVLMTQYPLASHEAFAIGEALINKGADITSVRDPWEVLAGFERLVRNRMDQELVGLKAADEAEYLKLCAEEKWSEAEAYIKKAEAR